MTVEEIEVLNNELKNLINNQKLKNKLYIRGKWRDHTKAVEQAKSSIEITNKAKELQDYRDLNNKIASRIPDKSTGQKEKD